MSEERLFKALKKWTFEDMDCAVQDLGSKIPTELIEAMTNDQLHTVPEIAALCEKSGWEFYEWQNEKTARHVSKMTQEEKDDLRVNELNMLFAELRETMSDAEIEEILGYPITDFKS